MNEIRNVVVVGAGIMGSGIAHVFALHDRDVTLIDVDTDRLAAARRIVERDLRRQAGKGVIDAGRVEETLARIRGSTEMARVADADFVIEAVTEDARVKLDIFRELDRLAPERALLASNTSSISITRLAGATTRQDRVAGMHFMNPVPVMPLVEIVRGMETSDSTVQAVVELATSLDKRPVVVRDSPGFVTNRVLLPMINEAVYCLMEGVADAESIDEIMRHGMNHPIGPLALADLIGLDTCLAILEVLHRELGEDKYRPCPLLRQYVAAGRLGRKSGRGFYVYA
ncbi:MAG TPA: 3-hydroxyacyl-CoA dehydrogenase NAD-binding domain-containing protein [Longimicrobiales bacterium]|nr:3-hydroxyacyl-CoA dehydrogenase NAD-binding domain-containing protein [Longimicrobiales bacterium]